MGIFGRTIINEVYFGNTSEIQQLQKILTNLRTDTIQNDKKFMKVGNTSEYLFEFNRKCEEIFGFKTFSLNIIYSDQINAFTFGLGGAFDVWNQEKHFKPTKNGMKFDKSAGYSCICFVFSALFMDERMSDREIMAIILHEIGHNFTSSMDARSASFATTKKIIRIVDLIMYVIGEMIENPANAISNGILGLAFSSNKVLGHVGKIKEELYKKNPKIFGFLNAYSGMMNSIESKIMDVLFYHRLITGKVSYVKILIRNIALRYNPIKLFKAFLGYNDEKLADSFATMYGYGPEISSGIMKMNYSKNPKSDLFDVINNMLFLPIYLLSAPCDEHPDSLIRALTQIKYLEDELQNTTTDKKMKKEITEQIKEIRNEIEDLKKKQNAYANSHTFEAASRLYSLTMYDLFGGDIRELTAKKDNNATISKNYYSKLKDIKLQ